MITNTPTGNESKPLASMYQFLNVENPFHRARIAKIVDTRLMEAGLDLRKLVNEMNGETPVEHPRLNEFVLDIIYEVNRAGYPVQILSRGGGYHVLLCKGRIAEIVATADKKLVASFSNEPGCAIPNPSTPDVVCTAIEGDGVSALFETTLTWLMDGTDMRKFAA